MIGDNDEFTAFRSHTGNVKLGLPGIGKLIIAGMNKADAGIVDGQIPAGDIHVFKTQNADFVLMSVYHNCFDNVGRKDVFTGFMGGITSVITGVRRQDGDSVLFQPAVGVAHDIPGIIELMVTQDKGVIADLLQAYGHGRLVCRFSGGAHE